MEQYTLFEDGKLPIRPAAYYQEMPWDKFRLACHFDGVYCVPTQELIHWLKSYIGGRKALEIGAGNGAIGRALGIRMTDSFVQRDNPEVRELYEAQRQPIVRYGDDVQKMEAVAAVMKYRPRVVVGSWITHKWREGLLSGSVFGVREDQILEAEWVEEYIMIGNRSVHSGKPLLSLQHMELYQPWYVSRANDQTGNTIYIWRKPNWRSGVLPTPHRGACLATELPAEMLEDMGEGLHESMTAEKFYHLHDRKLIVYGKKDRCDRYDLWRVILDTRVNKAATKSNPWRRCNTRRYWAYQVNLDEIAEKQATALLNHPLLNPKEGE